MLDKPDQVGYDERQALHDARTSVSAARFENDAAACKSADMTCNNEAHYAQE